MRIFIGFITFLFLSFSANYAQAKSIEVKSENFVLVGDLSAKNAKNLVEDLEEFRSVLLTLINKQSVPEAVPVHIYASKKTADLETMSGRPWEGIGGLYTSTSNGPAFILNSKGVLSKDSYARRIAFHEYVHHILHTYTERRYPRWYSEGQANYLASFEPAKNGVFKLGRPVESYGRTLQRQDWLPMSLVLSSVKKYPWKHKATSKSIREMQRMYYAQTWLAVHYIQSNRNYSRHTSKYVDLINRKVEPLKAFEQAYGVSPEAFEAELREYRRLNRFQRISINVPKQAAPKKIKVRTLNEVETGAYILEAKGLFVKKLEIPEIGK